MPYKPVLLINDELKTGYKYGVALPDDSGVLVHRLNLDISPVDLKAVRDSIYNQEEFNFRRIVRQEGPTKAELACFRMILVFELPEELVNKIENMNVAIIMMRPYRGLKEVDRLMMIL